MARAKKGPTPASEDVPIVKRERRPTMAESSASGAMGSGSESGDPDLRVSQRQPQSCTECTRRKTRCDKTVPCTNCRNRGVPHMCHIERIIPSKMRRASSQQSALLRSTVEANVRLEQRLVELERVVTALSGSASSSDTARIDGPKQEADEGEGGDGSGDGEGEGGDDEAEAAATLEFLAMGRLRGKSPGGLADEGTPDVPPDLPRFARPAIPSQLPRPATSGIERSLPTASPRAGSSRVIIPNPLYTPSPSAYLTSPQSQTVPTPKPWRAPATHRTTRKEDVISRLPSPEIGRQLIRYDVESIAWMHCCYHGPTFQSEAELFWDELGSPDVDVNFSFLALLFASLMSAVHHMPTPLRQAIFSPSNPSLAPGSKEILESYFQACTMSLDEADWMSSHSLYSVQCVAILVSPANHLDKADLYYTMLGTAIRIAQALNLHRIGPDQTSSSGSARVAREVRKRCWWQLIIQDWFHVAFNGTCGIHAGQFNTPPPIHCDEHQLGAHHVELLSREVPSVASHTIDLLKLAVIINGVFSRSSHRKIAYDQILRADQEIASVLAGAPSWMREEDAALPTQAAEWVEWQRRAFMVSAAHKMIVLHRPYLGRAFKGDDRYSRSREVCLEHAHKILRIFQTCQLETFRKTWTVLAHVMAASLVLLLAAKHPHAVHTPSSAASPTSHADLLAPVQAAVALLRHLASASSIAKRGVAIITPLLDEALEAPRATRKRKEWSGKEERELSRAAKVFRRTAVDASPSVAATPATPSQGLDELGRLLAAGGGDTIWMNSDSDNSALVAAQTSGGGVVGAVGAVDPFLEMVWGMSENPPAEGAVQEGVAWDDVWFGMGAFGEAREAGEGDWNGREMF